MANRSLFGGAMSAVLPQGCKDVSNFREIPDNQEVFAHDNTDQSIIVDILEYVSEEDQAAIRTHFEDVADANGACEEDRNIQVTEELPLDKTAMHQCKSIWYVFGQQKVSKFKEAAKNIINIHMGVFRLPQYSTDIVVTWNDPVIIDPSSSSNQAVPVHSQPWNIDEFKQLLTSLTILDPSLFGAD